MTETEIILERLKEVEANLDNRIGCLERKLLDPDNGLFSRVKENTNFRKTVMKWLGIVTLAVIGLLGRLIYDFFKGKF